MKNLPIKFLLAMTLGALLVVATAATRPGAYRAYWLTLNGDADGAGSSFTNILNLVASNGYFQTITGPVTNLFLSGGSGSATNAIANNSGFGTNTTIVTGLSIQATNILTETVSGITNLPLTISASSATGGSPTSGQNLSLSAGDGFFGDPGSVLIKAGVSASGVPSKVEIYPGYTDDNGAGTNLIGHDFGFGLITRNHFIGTNTFVNYSKFLSAVGVMTNANGVYSLNISGPVNASGGFYSNGIPVGGQGNSATNVFVGAGGGIKVSTNMAGSDYTVFLNTNVVDSRVLIGASASTNYANGIGLNGTNFTMQVSNTLAGLIATGGGSGSSSNGNFLIDASDIVMGQIYTNSSSSNLTIYATLVFAAANSAILKVDNGFDNTFATAIHVTSYAGSGERCEISGAVMPGAAYMLTNSGSFNDSDIFPGSCQRVYFSSGGGGGGSSVSGSATNVFFISGQGTQYRLVNISNTFDVVGILTNDISGNAATASVATTVAPAVSNYFKSFSTSIGLVNASQAVSISNSLNAQIKATNTATLAYVAARYLPVATNTATANYVLSSSDSTGTNNAWVIQAANSAKPVITFHDLFGGTTMIVNYDSLIVFGTEQSANFTVATIYAGLVASVNGARSVVINKSTRNMTVLNNSSFSGGEPILTMTGASVVVPPTGLVELVYVKTPSLTNWVMTSVRP